MHEAFQVHLTLAQRSFLFMKLTFLVYSAVGEVPNSLYSLMGNKYKLNIVRMLKPSAALDREKCLVSRCWMTHQGMGT